MGAPHPWGHLILGPHVVSHPTGHLKLTDFGLSRHLQWGERAHTTCGTLQYMGKGAMLGCGGGHSPPMCSSTHPHSPRGAERGALQPCSRLVVPGYPALRSGQWGGEDHGVGGIIGLHGPSLNPFLSPQFPVAPAGDHVAMLEHVKQGSYESPPAFSPALARLMAEVTLPHGFWGPHCPIPGWIPGSPCSPLLLHPQLLCHNPLHRLRYLHHFQVHPFFRGVAFDTDLLQKDPVVVVVAPQPPEQPPPDPATFDDFDCDLEVPLTASPGRPWPG